MSKKNILLDFSSCILRAELFETPIAQRFADTLPRMVSLQQWGNELYGSIDIDLGVDKPVPRIPNGGIAYTNHGNYLCIFFGQTPAWAVEHIGQIAGNEWEIFTQPGMFVSVTIRPETM